MKIEKIVSGGQTGADRAALDFALRYRIPYGGWVPKGRKTEDGRLPKRYNLQEMPSPHYSQRTRQNVIDSDGTVIFSHGFLTGGSLLTKNFARRYEKPCLHLDMAQTSIETAARQLNRWIEDHRLKTLNVAGPRAGRDSRIYHVTMTVLETTFCVKDQKE
jgi:hypothetical protein